MQILNKVGLIIAFTGLIGMFFFPDILSGYTKAERMGRVKYADTPKRRKRSGCWCCSSWASPPWAWSSWR